MGRKQCYCGIVVGVMALMTSGCYQKQKMAVASPAQSNLASSNAQQLKLSAGQAKLSPAEAAELAAKLANQECERLYHQQPFKAELWKAMLTGKRYQWGELDVGGPGGFSAQVTFDADGAQPHVEIYLTRDFPLLLFQRR